MAVAATKITVSCDWPTCQTHADLAASPAGEPTLAQARAVAESVGGWDTNRRRTVLNDRRGRQDFCPEHREPARQIRKAGYMLRKAA